MWRIITNLGKIKCDDELVLYIVQIIYLENIGTFQGLARFIK